MAVSPNIFVGQNKQTNYDLLNQARASRTGKMVCLFIHCKVEQTSKLHLDV